MDYEAPTQDDTPEPVVHATISAPGTPRFLTAPSAGRYAEATGTTDPIPVGKPDPKSTAPPPLIPAPILPCPSSLFPDRPGGSEVRFVLPLPTGQLVESTRVVDPVPAGRPGETGEQYHRRVRLFRVKQATERIMARPIAAEASASPPNRTVRRARSIRTRKCTAGSPKSGDAGSPPGGTKVGLPVAHVPVGAVR